MNLNSSNISSLKASQNSIYHILDLDTKGHDDESHPIMTKKRKPLQEAIRHDEEAFETSLALLCLSVKKKLEGDLTTGVISRRTEC